MIQKAGGVFRTSTVIPGANCQDFTSTGAPPAWSPGATLIDQVQLQVPAGHVWSLLGYSITAFLRLDQLAGGAFGKFGTIWTGVAPQQAQTGYPGVPWIGPGSNQPIPPLPQDASLIVPLWDPQVDPLPPVSASHSTPTANLLPITKGLQLPQPIDVRTGDQLGIGFWMSPSLMGNSSATFNSFILSILNATYSLTYDDGKPEPNPLH